MKVLLTYARLEDIQALVQLEAMCFTSDRLTKIHLKHLIHAKTAHVLVAKIDKILVGSAILLLRKNSTKARIYSLAIDPAYQHQGIAQQLCQKLEKIALKDGRQEIVLEVRNDNKRAIKFYRKQNYHLFGIIPQFYADGSDALRMRKDLGPVVN